MSGQEAMWTVLPNGIVGDPANRLLRLSVFVSPRLQDEQTAGGAPGAFADWPANLQPGRVSFTVQAAGGQPGTTATVVSPPPDSSLWAALFGSATSVVPHSFDDLGTQQVYSSYPIGRLHDELKKCNQQLAAPRSALDISPESIHTTFEPLLQAMAPLPPSGTSAGTESRSSAGSGLEALRQLSIDTAHDLLRHDPATDFDGRLAGAMSVAGQLAAANPGTPVPLVAETDHPANPFAQMAAFHRAAATPVTAPLTGPPPIIEFHQALNFLADHPDLMRRLGLVIDLQIPLGALPHSATGETAQRVQVLPVFTPPLDLVCHSPFTAYRLEGNALFEPAPTPVSGAPPTAVPPSGPPSPTPHPLPQTELFQGLLNLLPPDGSFDILQLDLDGGGLKVLGMLAGEALQSAVPTSPSGDSELIGVPALRSNGVTISRSGHAEVLLNRMATARTHNDDLTGGKEVTFFAEDLVRGYRVDVQGHPFDAQPDSTPWLSLHQRVGTYFFPAHPSGPQTLTITDEGAVQPAITRNPGPDGVQPDPASPLFIHEGVAHWTGFSLSAPRLGAAATPDGPGSISSRPPSGGLPIQITSQAVEGSLPRLRFGWSYRFRARAVDLAGNSLTIDEADSRLESIIGDLNTQPPVLPAPGALFLYRRYEPVPSPVLVPRERFTEGECVDRLVIRSRAGSTAAQYAAQLMKDVATGARYLGVSERHMVPPKTSLAMAEIHGMLEPAFGPVTGQEQTYPIALKSNGTLSDAAVRDTSTGQMVPIPDTTDVNPLTGATETRPSVEVVVTGTTASGDRGYAVHHEAVLKLPYLPDPITHGAALFGVPGLPSNGNPAGVLDHTGNLTFVASPLAPDDLKTLGGSSLHLDFGTAWPDLLPFRLQLAEPPSATEPQPAPHWDPTGRVLTVFLGKAEQATIRLSSFLSLDSDPNVLTKLGMWSWMDEIDPQPGEQTRPDREATALQGGNCMITPFRPLKLVHAVEAPLIAPTLDPNSFFPRRDPNTTFAYLGGNIGIHGKSTAKLDLTATWTEVDDTQPDGPVTNQHTQHVLEVQVTLPGEGDGTTPSNPEIVPVAAYDAATDTITLQGPAVDDESGRTYTSRHEFGDTKYRRISYQAAGTSRFREYFPSVVADDPTRITATGQALSVDVLSSARPPKPVVVSVLPAFRWTRGSNPDGVRQSTRHGGVRVYLDRPWFVSGDGELLAVVLTDAQFYPPSPQLAPFVTHWGQNPAFTGVGGLSAPTLGSFPGAVATTSGQGLPLDELLGLAGLASGAESVAAAGHTVQFDPVRRLWYCDIDVSGAPDQVYHPYLQLALARYQPNSLPGKELSPVVHAMVQVPPPRTVTLSPVSGQNNLFDLAVTGNSYGSTSWHTGDDQESDFVPRPNPNPPHNMVKVQIQQRIPGTDDDLGWTTTGEVTPTSAAVAAVVGVAPTGLLWQGQLQAPAGSTPQQFRILIQEFERFNTTDTVEVNEKITFDPDLPPDKQPTPQHPEIVPHTFHPGAARLVFAETITL